MLWMANSGGAPAPHSDFWFGPTGLRTLSGTFVSPDSAMRLSTVYACIRVKAETVGVLPLILYRRLPNGGKERAVTHPLYRLLSKQPNPLQTSFEWRGMMEGHLDLRGNAYSLIDYTPAGQIAALWPLHPDRVEVKLKPGGRGLIYKYKPKDGPEVPLLQDEILHLRGLSSDGYVGMSPIEVQRETLGYAQAARDFGSQFYQNMAVPPGWLEHPTNFKDEAAREQFRQDWRAQHGGPNRGKIAILEYGLKYHEIGMKMTDAQYLETVKATKLDICQIWRMPPHKAGILDQAKWANIEQQSIDFVTDAIMPATTAWEQRLNMTLLTEDEQEEYFFEYLLDGLLKGDSAARSAYYEKALKNRWMVPNEVRDRENLNPTDWGNDPLPVPNQPAKPEPTAGDKEEPEDEDAPAPSREAQLERRNAQHVVQKEVHQVRSLKAKLQPHALAEAVLDFYRSELGPFVAKVMVIDEAVAARYVDDSIATLSSTPLDKLDALLADWLSVRVEHLLEVIHA